MKKFISIFLSIVLLSGVLTGCTTHKQENETIELNFWHLMSGAGMDALQRQVDAFNSGIGLKEGIHVNTVYIDWPGTAAFATALQDKSQDTMPDIFQLYGNMVSYVTDLDNVAWADDFFNKDYCTIKKDDFIPSTIEAFTINEKLLALPYAISSMLLFYNQSYLEQAGFSDPPSTLEEMARMLPQIVSKTDAKVGLHAKITDYELEHFLATQGSTGAYITDENNGRNGNITELICSNELNSFLNEWQKVVSTGCVYNDTRSTTEEFASGVDAMALMTSARISSVADMVGDSFKWNVAKIPLVNLNDIGGSNVYGSSLVMFNHNDEKRIKATWMLMEYLTSSEAQTMLMEDMGYLPVRKDTVQYEKYQESVKNQPQLGVLFDILNKAPKTAISVFFPNSSEIDAAMTNGVEKFEKGILTSDQATELIISDCNKIIKEYNSAGDR